jgi:uncharacterized protein (TIGR03437 family)
VSGLDVDAAGNALIVGSGFVQPTAGAFQTSLLGGTQNQLVVAKIAPDGSVLGSTYVGAQSGLAAIAAERDGSVLVAGVSAAIDFVMAGGRAYFAANFFPAITLENAASYVSHAVAPGELISIRGYDFEPDGVQVYFDNFAAPVFYAAPGQINAQVPWEIAGRTTTQVRILTNGATLGSVAEPVLPALPGVFYVENPDGSLNSPANPAHPGDFLSLYGTGGGVLDPLGLTGSSWPLRPLSILSQPVAATVGGEPVGILYAGSAPGLESGVFQINAQLPSNLAAGVQILILSIGGMKAASVTVYLTGGSMMG